MLEQIKKSISPKFFFLSLGVIISLIISFSTICSLFFDVLNIKFPDTLNTFYNYSSIQTELAILIIIFPLFLTLSYFWKKEIKKGILDKKESLFKWIVYIILFLAILVAMIDIVMLLNYFLSGEITNRFIIKVLFILIITSISFFYYYTFLKDYKNKIIQKNKTRLFLSYLSKIIFLGIIILSFFITGSPKTQRSFRLDEIRVNDLQNIQWQIIAFWQKQNTLPNNLYELKDPISNISIPNDPEYKYGKNYKYIIKDNLSFELCAEFSENSQELLNENFYLKGDSWEHTKGEFCFNRIIDPKLYKTINE